MRGKRVAILSAGGDSSKGGVERFTSLLETVLGEAGWQCSVISPTEWPSRTLFRVGAGPLYLARSAARGIPRTRPPDLVISNGTLGAFVKNAPRIHVYHGTMVAHTLRGDKRLPLRERARRVFGQGLAEALAGRGAVRVAVSETAAAEVARYYRLRVHEVIPNGVDTRLFAPRDRAKARERFGLRDETNYALFVGRAETRKGADLLRPTCERAGWELLIAGAEIEGSQSLGVLTHEELADAYTAADAVLFPTRYEACSFVILEALACGAPVITTEVGWTRTLLEHVPEYRALIVRPSVDSLVAGLRAATTVDRSVVASAREWVVANNDLETFAERWRELAERTVRA